MRAAGPATKRPFITERLGRRAVCHPRVLVVVWLLAAAAAAVVFLLGEGVLSVTDDFLVQPESKRVEQLVADRLPGQAADVEVVVVRSEDHAWGDADGELVEIVAGLSSRIRALGDKHVAEVVSMADAVERQRSSVTRADAADGGGDAAAQDVAERLVSADGRTALILVTLVGNASEAATHFAPLGEIVDEADGRDGLEVAVTGAGAWEHEARELAEADLRRGELVGIPVALVILLIVFGAAVAALIPLVLAVVAICVALALTVLIGATFDVSIFAVNIITMMGLAVGIDYSLLVVSRFREERDLGRDVARAIAAATATASRAVLFSGSIVVLALLGMLIVPYTIFTSLGVGSILVVIVAVGAALTLLPAALRLLGHRVDWLKVRRRAARTNPADERERFWPRAARIMMRRPLISLVVSCAALIALAAPMTHMKTGMASVNELPEWTNSRRAFVVLQEEFSAGMASPIVVTFSGDLEDAEVATTLEKSKAALAGDRRYSVVAYDTHEDGRFAVLKIAVNAGATSGAALAAVHDLRRLAASANAGGEIEVLVGGMPGVYADAIDLIDVYTPWVIALVLGLSFFLLLLAFRSVLIAAQSILMNLLSAGASYGLVTLVFQDGYGAGLLGFTQVERVMAWLPLLMFCVLFGLSMDYHIFLVSRISERFAQTRDTSDAVIHGVASTAGIITGAALIMVAVFAGVAMGELTMFQQLGFGLAVAVLIDATVVRTVTVPAAMTLLGRHCWYLPRWLGWLPQVNAEGPAPLTGGTDNVGHAQAADGRAVPKQD